MIDTEQQIVDDEVDLNKVHEGDTDSFRALFASTREHPKKVSPIRRVLRLNSTLWP